MGSSHKGIARGGRYGTEHRWGRITLSGRGKGRLNRLQNFARETTEFPAWVVPPPAFQASSPQPQRVEKPHEKVTFAKDHPSYFPFPKRGTSESRCCNFKIFI